MRPSRIDYLDGIRGLAIAAVLVVHWGSPYAHGFLRGGYIGVDLFLVLSGFVITSILWRTGDSYARFLRNRIKRLYPALLGALALGLILMLAVDRAGALDVAGDAALALTQASSIVRAAGVSSLGPFGHMWSLSVEWVFYLIWPLVVAGLKARGIPARRVAVISLCIALGIFMVAQFLSADWFYYGPVSRSAQLFLGGSLALWALGGNGSPLPSAVRHLISLAAPIAVVGVIAYIMAGPWYDTVAYRTLGFPFAASAGAVLILGGRISPDSVTVRVLGSRLMSTLGRVSYSLYLWHYIALSIFGGGSVHLPLPARAAAMIAFTVAATWASYRWLEKPFMSNRSGLIGAGHTVSVTADGDVVLGAHRRVR